MSEIIARCTRCYSEFTEKQFEEAPEKDRCPHCKTKGVPMDPRSDVSININVHELRILGIWAENWAVHCDNQHLDDVNHEPMKELVNIICTRILKQLPKNLKMSLTLSGEIKDLQKDLQKREEISGDIILYRDGREEIV
jgi:DNA-directed RNA polymerase subunit RPC12/RpoP